MATRVGIDLARVDEVREAIATHGGRYLERVYTRAEIEQSAGDPERLAARFAAKEAAMKVLRPERTDAVPWPSIEVRRRGPGWVELALSGPAAALAAEQGLTELAVSFTHDGDRAAAVVMAST